MTNIQKNHVALLILKLKSPTLLAFIFLVSQLSGCASWTQHGIIPDKEKKFHIAVLPLEVTAEVDKISDIMTPPPEIPDESALIREQMQNVALQLSDFLNTKLSESDYIQIVPIEMVDHSTIRLASTTPYEWSVEELHKMKTDYGVQAVLVVKVAGYGKLEKKWLTFLIGTGVVEGIVQGVVAARVVDNTWVGVAVAVEEIVQEILVWGGGSYLFNKHYAPVTLEAQVISTTDGTVVWDDTIFVSIDKDAIELLPEQDRKKRELHLELTAKKAINELVEKINKKARSKLGIKNSPPKMSGKMLAHH